jgi:hypothetical protein
MSDDACPSPRCPLCGRHLDVTEPRVAVPDLRIEMHEACYQHYVGKHPKCSNSSPSS